MESRSQTGAGAVALESRALELLRTPDDVPLYREPDVLTSAGRRASSGWMGMERVLVRNNRASFSEIRVTRYRVGEIVGPKLQPALKIVLAGLCLFYSSGCGGSSSGANVVTVLVTPATPILILGQSVNLLATVNGATNTDVTWPKTCQYTTTTTTNGKTTTSALTDCPSDGSFGALSNPTTTTITYTAPDPSKFQLPDQTKYPGLQIVITATSVQDTKKSGKANIVLISGIRAVITPLTASVPTKESQQFFANLTNDIQNQGTTWLLTQNVPNTDSKGN